MVSDDVGGVGDGDWGVAGVVLADEVPRGEDTGGHVLDAGGGDGAVVDGSLQGGAEVGSSSLAYG